MARRKDTFIGGGTRKGLYGGDSRGLYTAKGRRSKSGMYIYSKPPRRWPKVVIALVIVLVVVGCVWQFALGGLPFLKQNKSENEQKLLTSVNQQIALLQKSTGLADLNGTPTSGLNTTITISAVGDCTLGSDPKYPELASFDRMYSAAGPSYFFENVTSYTNDDDLTIANCEGTFSTSTDIVQKQYNFKGPAEYTQIFTDGGVEAANLANNHSFDFGNSSYEDTKTALNDAGITSFGYDRTATYQVNGITIGLFGICELDDHEKGMKLLKDDIASLQKQGCALIIGVFHWGMEGEYAPEQTQVEMAHAAIDAGCDLVLGGHPHVLQGIEYYKQRYICYSLGNFCFGGNTNPSDKNTMIFQQTFTFKNGQLFLNNETRKGVRVVPCSISSVASYNDYQPTPLSGEEGTAAIERLNGYSNMLAGDGVELSTELDDSGFANVK